MNKLFTKIAGAVLGLTLTIGVGLGAGQHEPQAVHAADEPTTETLAIAGTTGNFTGASISWVTDSGVNVFTNNQAKSSTAIRTSDSDHYRIYAHSSATFECTGGKINSLTITCTSGSYATVFATSAGSEASASGSTVTITLSAPNGTYTIDDFTAQTRIRSIVFNYSIDAGSVETYTVSFNKNGGDGEMAFIPDQSGSYILPENGFTAPAGKAFVGWKAGDEGELLSVGSTYLLTENVTFYAQWEYVYSVTYEAGENGNGTQTLSNLFKGEYVLPKISELSSISADDGYVFDNYSVNDETKNPGDTIDLNSDLSIIVNFKIKPLAYIIEFGSVYNNNPTEIKNDESFKNTYSFDGSDDVTLGDFSKVYGVSNSQLKMGSSKYTATISFTIPTDCYITSVEVEVATGASFNLEVVSGATNATTESQSLAVGTLVFDDYLGEEQSNYVKLESSANGAFYLSSIVINYGIKAPKLDADLISFDLNVNSSTDVELIADNYTPTNYSVSIQSGSSLTTSSFVFDGDLVTVTAGNVVGETVARITGTNGEKSAYVDLTVNVIASKEIVSLEVTASGTTAFKEGDLFSVGALEVTATFSDDSETVYSDSEGNLALLTFDPEIGTALTVADTLVTVYVTSYGEEVFTGYDIVVAPKTYASKVSDVRDLWDGQQIYLGNSAGTYVGTKHAGNNNNPSVEAVVDSEKGLCVDDSTGAQAYTISRVNLEGNVYYTFFDGTNYLSDKGTTKSGGGTNNYLKLNSTLSDLENNCTYFSITIDSETGEAEITSKSNTVTPYLRWNDNNKILSCYASGQQKPVLYAAIEYSEDAVAKSFEENRLHLNDYTEDLGWCSDSEHHYYDDAKAVWSAMSEDEKISTSGEAIARLQAWANANGDVLDSDLKLVSKSRTSLTALTENNNIAILIIVIASSMTLIAGVIVFKRKKNQLSK